MPGYIFNLDSEEAVEQCAINGVYGTRITRGARNPLAQLATLADYLTMREGFLVFFFQDRMIYGVGKVVGIQPKGRTMASLCNFPESDSLATRAPPPSRQLAADEGVDGKDVRWVVFYEPFPRFVKHGLDMDEALTADKYGAMRQLRVFWKRSFMEIEDDEAQLLADLLFQKNRAALIAAQGDRKGSDAKLFFDKSKIAASHSAAAKKASNGAYAFDPARIVRRYVVEEGRVTQEAALQAWLVYHLTEGTQWVKKIFGRFDVVINQVAASPFKPPDWMDKIDIFGYSRRKFVEGLPSTVTAYKIIELKRHTNKEVAEEGPNPIDQTMKYVDWIANTRAGGDYSLVKAFLITKGFDADDIGYAAKTAKREYVVPRRPFTPAEWHRFTLVSYEANADGEISLRKHEVDRRHEDEDEETAGK
ncbi:MAG: hypothetical protein JRN59_06230 [Nitrososphaerota archaeon]|nr:hypothetical protein [Nitrososphaerota archaeon]